ncbi:hypothetical protein SO802_005094 [Lithocarpus litseifolius]|uniref:Reverse transcriptase zinc-binding domain-containing protein n=1 Tax=Lithocarpus litseifolius TaxID=425828 RepID=A0AAW2DHS8_9ROSI
MQTKLYTQSMAIKSSMMQPAAFKKSLILCSRIFIVNYAHWSSKMKIKPYGRLNGVILELACFFCRNCLEDRNHLFFGCPFAKRIWESVMNFFLVSDPEFEWDELAAWGLAHLKGKSFKSVCVNWLGGLPSTMVHIWLQRNAIMHASTVCFEEQSLKSIRRNVSARLDFKQTSNILQ